MKAAEDFLLVVLHAHIIAASEEFLSKIPITSVDELSHSVLDSFVNLRLGDDEVNTDDGVFIYARELLTLGLFWMGFHDAIREGDGERVTMYWKFLLPIFKTLGRKKYSVECVKLQLQRSYHLSPRQSAQLVWSRFVNTHGRVGCNIPCDLHLEHHNRRLKTLLRHLGSNLQKTCIERAAKSIGVVHKVCEVFEMETRHKCESDKHAIPGSKKDFDLIISVLKDTEVFVDCPGRSHSAFCNIKGVLGSFIEQKFYDWVKCHIY